MYQEDSIVEFTHLEVVSKSWIPLKLQVSDFLFLFFFLVWLVPQMKQNS